MTDNNNDITIIQPDDWHVHLREGQLLSAVVDDTAKIFGKCIAMPNLKSPLIKRMMVKNYKNNIYANSSFKNLKVFVPCFLTDQIDLNDFLIGIKNNYFFGAKLYPLNATTNSSIGVNNLEKIFPALEILEEYNAPLLIHAEKPHSDISIFDREKYFIDDEMQQILKRFQNLKIVIEHISSEYGANFVNESNSNLASTITLHHLLLTKKDVFNGDINPYNFCMPVVKDEKDLIVLRKFACSGNKKFFLGTDSAPHDVKDKKNLNKIKPGIYTSPIAIEMSTMIEVPLILVFFVGIAVLIITLNLIKINRTLDKIVKEKFSIKSSFKSSNNKPDKAIAETEQEGDFITAPMVGIIYLKPEPTKPQFVNVGDHIKQGDTVAIIEAMKTYSNVRASKSGIIKEILVKNGTPVEYGEKIICIE